MAISQKLFLGADVGASKTRLAIADENGRILGYGLAGPGNHEVVGYKGLSDALKEALKIALSPGLDAGKIAGAGLGVGGLDFPSELPATLEAISVLGIKAPLTAVNDALIGLLAGSPKGWGVAVVSGTGCNCMGWDASRQKIGRVTGHGLQMGEGAGATELIEQAVMALAHEWSGRGPATSLTPAMVRHVGAKDLDDLIEGLCLDRYEIGADAAPLIFQAAAEGDGVALGLIDWAGRELGEMAKSVIRQLGFEKLEFDVVMVGSVFDGGAMLTQPMQNTIQAFAPGSRFIRLNAPPVIGAVLLGMEAAGHQVTAEIRRNLEESVHRLFPRSKSS